VDPGAPALKPTDPAFDSEHAMRLDDLKMRVQRADYAIDPATVAVAMIRHSISQMRWWNPRTFCVTPAALSATAGGPSATMPIQVSGAADSAAARSSRPTQTHNS
jgi:hypothetical protein